MKEKKEIINKINSFKNSIIKGRKELPIRNDNKLNIDKIESNQKINMNTNNIFEVINNKKEINI